MLRGRGLGLGCLGGHGRLSDCGKWSSLWGTHPRATAYRSGASQLPLPLYLHLLCLAFWGGLAGRSVSSGFGCFLFFAIIPSATERFIVLAGHTASVLGFSFFFFFFSRRGFFGAFVLARIEFNGDHFTHSLTRHRQHRCCLFARLNGDKAC